MLKEVIEDALSRGEKLKKDIVGQILKSATLNELFNNKKFTDTIARVIQTKDEISRSIHRNVQEALKVMHIPSKHELSAYERRVDLLERKIETLSRNVMKKKMNGHSEQAPRTVRKPVRTAKTSSRSRLSTTSASA